MVQHYIHFRREECGGGDVVEFFASKAAWDANMYAPLGRAYQRPAASGGGWGLFASPDPDDFNSDEEARGIVDSLSTVQQWAEDGFTDLTTREVVIPRVREHGGFASVTVRLKWCCPKCGGPRGTPFGGLSYDGSRRLAVDQWVNPCGHIDSYADVRKEAGIREQPASPFIHLR